MPINRFFTPDELKLKTEAIISGQEFHHIANVIRTREGEHVELVNGKGILALAILVKKTRHEAFFAIEKIDSFPSVQLNLSLHQAIPKISKLEIILEKCTELGVSEFVLFPSEKSEKQNLSPSHIERLNYILISAMKQSGRFYLPKLSIESKMTFLENKEEVNIFGDIRNNSIPLIKLLDHKYQNKKINLFIGPESGFSEHEVHNFDNHHFLKAKLSNHILRTETASVAGVSIIQHFYLT